MKPPKHKRPPGQELKRYKDRFSLEVTKTLLLLLFPVLIVLLMKRNGLSFAEGRLAVPLYLHGLYCPGVVPNPSKKEPSCPITKAVSPGKPA